jgi:hypothetical protein
MVTEGESNGEITLFPAEAVIELLVNGTWETIKPGSLAEFKFGPDKLLFVQYVDNFDGNTVIVEDAIVRGWRLDSNKIVKPARKEAV